MTLKHSFQPNGKGATTTESLSQPDDLVTLGGNLYVGSRMASARRER